MAGRPHPGIPGRLHGQGPRTRKGAQAGDGCGEKWTGAVCQGNHEEKILQKLIKGTKAKEEVMETLRAIKAEGPEFIRQVIDFIDGLPYVMLCRNDILIVHGGLKEELQDLDTTDRKLRGRIKRMAIYGDITGRQLEDGRPERLDWAADYKGKMTVIYGHTIVDRVEWRNNTVNIDTGCFRTGILTAVRMPERNSSKPEDVIYRNGSLMQWKTEQGGSGRMKYRKMGKTGDEVSILGFGCMRFPHQNGRIDLSRTERRILMAIDRGVNYFDTAYIYHGGRSESILGDILAKGYRDKVRIAYEAPRPLWCGPKKIWTIYSTASLTSSGQIMSTIICSMPSMISVDGRNSRDSVYGSLLKRRKKTAGSAGSVFHIMETRKISRRSSMTIRGICARYSTTT